ncbi:hypothetical protein [Caballeronia sp. ATUFL_M1_KS5A]|uniref:DUF6998 domain-containing protein n=1 Tax=Caballeronia sp. ATUFL_M1_KS5A TaxID=2921778 RepID=UPI002028BC99|nr:hypothetical protein [Caballeronia sp. ATUFL_M1_KS5A]
MNGRANLSERTVAIQHVLASIFASQMTLRTLAPEFKWAGLGNLLGDFGELVAIEAYGLRKASPGSNGYDALMSDGRTVQIKANFAASAIGFRGSADLLLVLSVNNDGSWSEMYFGPFEPVAAASRRSERDNKSTISLSKLRQMHALHGFRHDALNVERLITLEVLPPEPSCADEFDN